MSNTIKSILKYAVILGVILFLLWYAFYSMDLYPDDDAQSGTLSEKLNFVFQEWKSCNPLWLLLSGFIAILSHLQRGIRWKMLLSPLGYKVKTSNAFLAVINGYLVNLLIPRGGEISRPVMLKRLEGVPTATSIGTVVAERVIDLLFLIILLSVVVIFQLTRFYEFFTDYALAQNNPDAVNSFPKWGFLLIGTGIVAIGTFIIFKVNKGLFDKLKIKFQGAFKELKSGFLVVKQLDNNWLFVIHSLLIWVFYYAMLYSGLMAYGPTADLSAFDALTIFVVSGIAMAIPLPGGAGSFHLLVPLALIHLCGVSPDMGKPTAFATVYHLYQTLILIITGGICLGVSQRLSTRTSPEPIE